MRIHAVTPPPTAVDVLPPLVSRSASFQPVASSSAVWLTGRSLNTIVLAAFVSSSVEST